MRAPGKVNLALIREHVDRVDVASEAEIEDAGGRRRFGVVTMGPAPRMRASRAKGTTYGWDSVDDGIRISLLIDRLDIKEEQIARTVRWFAPPVMRVTSVAPVS